MQRILPVESGIIHDYNAAGLQRWKQHRSKPIFKQPAVHRAAVLQGSYYAFIALAGYKACSLVLLAAYPSMDGYPPGSSRIRTVQVLIYTCFIDIDDR